MRIVSEANPAFPNQQQFKLLWLLIGGDENNDRATACFLGQDRAQDGGDAAGATIDNLPLAGQEDFGKARKALKKYRGVR